MPNPWLIPDDGIVDDVAIEIAVRGRRPVCLTRLERSVAAALILAMGGGTRDLCERLKVTDKTACQLARQARRLQEIAAESEDAFPRLRPAGRTAAAS
jgi:hypothetical protein